MGQELDTYDRKFNRVYYMKLFCPNCVTTWTTDFYKKETIKEPGIFMKIMLALFGKKEVREEDSKD